MRKLRLLGLLAVAVALVVPALAGGATSKVLSPGCGGSDKAAYKPSKIIIACGDGNLFVTKLKWTSWGTKTAKGNGTAHQNTCTPNCAQGKFKTYPMSLVLSVPKKCAHGKHEFAELKYTYTGKRPKGVRKSSTVPRGCTA